MDKIWVLTASVNEYDQFGEYFVAWFPEKPVSDQLLKVGVQEHLVEVTLEGSELDRSKFRSREVWYHLREVASGTDLFHSCGGRFRSLV